MSIEVLSHAPPPSLASGFATNLSVYGRLVVVAGGTGQALSQIVALRDAGADVLVVAPSVVTSIEDLADRGHIMWRSREFEEQDLDDAWLAIAASGVPELDRDVEAACSKRRLLCRVADSPDTGPRPLAPTGGRVTLVGGGPGDPELLTIAGVRALADADVVIADRLAPLGHVGRLRPGVEIIDVAKVPFGRSTAQSEINRLLVEHAQRGAHVVRLKGGDNFLFGRGGEEVEACVAANVPVEVVPGVTSALAVPGAAGIPVTHRGLSQGVTVVSGHVAPDDPSSSVDYAALAQSGTTLVLLMAVRTLPQITSALIKYGMDPATPAATVADGTLRGQRSVVGTLSTIAADVAAAGLAAPAVTVIGAVAALGARSAAACRQGT